MLAALVLVVCIFGTQLALLNLPQANAAYTIGNSARFVSGNSDYLNRTPGSMGNRKTWTFSTWVKRGTLAANQAIFSAYSANTDAGYAALIFNSSDQLSFVGGSTVWRASNAVFRDPAAWINIVLSFDTTNATAQNRIRMYVNGVEITSWASNNAPTLNADYVISSTSLQYLGITDSGSGSTKLLDGYMADVYFVDGQQLAPSSFGTNDSNGYWRPIAYSGTYGTNGFKLNFANSAALGNDSSGNSNTWTVNGLVAVDQVIDTPTNSFATQSAITGGSNRATISEGGLKTTSGVTTVLGSASTFSVNSGKWYWEVTNVTAGSSSAYPVIGAYRGIPNDLTNRPGGDVNGFGYFADAGGAHAFYIDAAATAIASFTAGDVIGIALDLVNNQVSVYKNNVLQTTQTIVAGTYTPAESNYNGSVTRYNSGQGGQSDLTYDSASGGNFKYTPPSGYKALSTYNLPAPTITVPKNYFDAVTYVGTGSTQNVLQSSTSSPSVLGFTPDLVWIKDRTTTNAHGIFDSVRTATNYWSSNANTTETTSATSLTAFLSNGFTLGSNSLFNTSSNNYVSWLWKKSPTTDGVDIVTYSGDNTANRNISHSLGAAPDMVIVKSRNVAGDPNVWHSSLSGATSFLLLDTTAAQTTTNSPWGTGNFSSTQFMVTNNATNNTNAAPAAGTTTVTYSTAGTFSFSVPDFTYMTVTVKGAGGGGGGVTGATTYSCGKGCTGFLASPAGSNGGAGGNSSFNASVVGNGGGGGGGSPGGVPTGSAGSSGTASGGDTNTTGGGTSGGAAASNNCATTYVTGGGVAGAGGAGGQAVKAYTTGGISGSITVVVGAGASGGAGGVGDVCTGNTGSASGAGSVVISYSGGTTATYVAYLFKGVPGFSKFGSYTGNGSADGPFIYTGFKPRYVMIKRTDTTGSWQVHDTARSSFNPMSHELYPNSSAAEDTTWLIDSDVNGFKLRSDSSSTDNNATGGTYIYAAFADVPFKYSASPASSLIASVLSGISFLIGMAF